jgi:hypothetical protein|tara:strand:+ start:92 stop:532 length:441 start_codon:yes stop_codon:yes gene_type:complete
MSEKKRESLLWNRVKKNLTDCFLTRIESSTINGIPDIHCVANGKVFWIELKSDNISYPALNKWQIVWINKYIKAGGSVFIFKETLSDSSLQIYRPLSSFTDPRSVLPWLSLPHPVNWKLLQRYLLDPDGRARSRPDSRPRSRSRFK